MVPDQFVSVVDDDESCREAIASLVRSLGFAVAAFESADAFLASGDAERTTCVIADIQMRAMTGVELCRHLNASAAPVPTVLVTAYPSDTGREEAQAAGAVAYLLKPVAAGELIRSIDAAGRRNATGIRGSTFEA